MAIQLFSNNSQTTLTANLPATGPGSTALAVQSSAKFPSLANGDWFIATIQRVVDGITTAWEIVQVVAISGNNWTIVRAQENTAPQPWSIGDTVALLPTAGGLSQFLQDASRFPITQAEAALGFTSATIYGKYDDGDSIRYGMLPNINTPAQKAANTAAWRKLCSYGLNPTGWAGDFTFINITGGDTYFFNDITDFRPGIDIDLQQCTLNFSKSAPSGNEVNSGFLHAIRDFSIRNGSIVVNFPSGAGNGSALFFGARDSESTYFPNTFDAPYLAATGRTLGNIHLQNLYITSNNPNSLCIGMLGGIQNMSWDNVWFDGQNVCGGAYGEFGWATNEVSRYQRQTSHPHNINIRNLKATNIGGVLSAFGINGGYGISIDGIYVDRAAGVIGFGVGESLFFRPWAGVDDGPVSQRTVSARNIVGKGITSSGIALNGASPAQVNPYTGAGYLGWTAGRFQTTGDYQINGPNVYICTQTGTTQAVGTFLGAISGTALTVPGPVTGSPIAIGNALSGVGLPGVANPVRIQSGSGSSWVLSANVGTVSSETMTVSQGPTGTGTGIVDGSCKWDYVSSALPIMTDILGFDIQGFEMNQTPSGTNYGVVSTGGSHVILRDGRCTNFGRAINFTAEVVNFLVENVDGVNSAGGGFVIGNGFNIYPAPRLSVGVVTGCYIVGSGADGVTAGPAISVSNTTSLKINNNRFGSNTAFNARTELTQLQAVLLQPSCHGVICDGNYVQGIASGPAFSTIAFTSSQGCTVTNTNFDASIPTPYYSGLWENMLDTISPDNGDANATYIPHTEAKVQWFGTTLTADRVLNLSTLNAVAGDKMRTKRSAGGAFNLTVSGVKNLPANTWCDAEYDGSAWTETASGPL